MSLRMTTAGESHGPGLTTIVEGLPAGLQLDQTAINGDMARRQLGFGRGGRMKIETDTAEVTAGVRHGRTLGGPVAMQIANRDYKNWDERMNPWPVEGFTPEPVTMPRPGHADLVGVWKYKQDDVRNILERASARETAARVAGGALAKALLSAVGVEIRSHVAQIGTVHAEPLSTPSIETFDGVDDDPVRCLDKAAAAEMVKHITVQRKANESIGGVYEIFVFGLLPGLGSHISWEERLDGRLAQAICSIQAHKGVEFGEGFGLAATPGSQAQDEIFAGSDSEDGDIQTGSLRRRSNHAGGLEGGMTTGQPLVIRSVVKPIPTITQPLRSVDLNTGEPAKALRERTDSCVVPAAGVVGEAMVALILASTYCEKFGGDHIDDMLSAISSYRERIGWNS